VITVPGSQSSWHGRGPAISTQIRRLLQVCAQAAADSRSALAVAVVGDQVIPHGRGLQRILDIDQFDRGSRHPAAHRVVECCVAPHVGGVRSRPAIWPCRPRYAADRNHQAPPPRALPHFTFSRRACLFFQALAISAARASQASCGSAREPVRCGRHDSDRSVQCDGPYCQSGLSNWARSLVTTCSSGSSGSLDAGQGSALTRLC
jgi:hypothetical protein